MGTNFGAKNLLLYLQLLFLAGLAALLSSCQATGSNGGASEDDDFATLYREISTQLSAKYFGRPRYSSVASGYLGVHEAKFEIDASGNCILVVHLRGAPAIKMHSVDLEVRTYDQTYRLNKREVVSLRGNFPVEENGTVRIAIPGSTDLSFEKSSPPWSLSGNQKARATIWLKDFMASELIVFKINGVSPRAAELASNIAKQDNFELDDKPAQKPGSRTPAYYAQSPAPSRAPAYAPEITAPRISYGSGFVFSNEGYAATNLHVVQGATSIYVQQVLPTGQLVKRKARIKITDDYYDLAVLEIENWAPLPGAHPNPPPVVSSNIIKVGDQVFVVGYPLPNTLSPNPKFSRGDISDLAGPGDNRKRFQHTAPIQPGSSGGPTCLANGSVVGVVVSSLNDLQALQKTGAVPQAVNFSVKSNMLLGMINAHSIAPTFHPPSSDPIRQVIDYTVQIIAEK